MRLRIYKRKVLALLLALAAAACALALWSSSSGSNGGGEAEEEAAGPKAAAEGEEAAAAAALAGSSVSSSVGVVGGSVAGPGPGSASSLGGGAANASWGPASWASPAGPGAGNGSWSPRALRSLVYRLNFDQAVRQEALWTAAGEAAEGASGEASLALVVQVHERAEHLRLLLASLRRAPGAEKVLLVLSHDVWSPELNALAASVDFCAVVQIFFPFSRQLYPREFPGSDPRDCPRDVGRAAAERRGCLNARFPDSFGHYREAAFAQAKHHWWWKLHFVWERLRALRRRPPALLLLLEEDHVVAPDFFAATQALWALRRQRCPDCQLLALGSYAALRGPAAALAPRAARAHLLAWRSTEHNMGMALPRETYEELRACARAFCTYDDYNWDWTLQHLTVACLPRFWKALVPDLPRVFHTGDCGGMHHPPARACRPPAALAARLDALLDAARPHLFPAAMSLARRHALAPVAPHVKNGGWGDIRDHELCQSYQRLP
ncbi:alpha-1,6-mannosyl-glycoprotein 2-beta-N-acetylglucosaminyltransferase [Paroedura picta]|uniref:alpha-1,6-mannosyl-glycoprotein 2-beta-N-acetylglucosaminyltransferase n=1 Tax=Paroedura picta TaxID=143630 RepID=UPI004055F0B0